MWWSREGIAEAILLLRSSLRRPAMVELKLKTEEQCQRTEWLCTMGFSGIEWSTVSLTPATDFDLASCTEFLFNLFNFSVIVVSPCLYKVFSSLSFLGKFGEKKKKKSSGKIERCLAHCDGISYVMI
ncbi:hypothetical protein HS088_TW23G00558 [Tripterygium wilfordii]|uniref:Uncharacterized protein n=1 Tax=Tripterygium wilfordii TaxID=458696 RepID=A0A7J7BVH4_TRIWF|nr:hypothetical protein HS088_TW23G00558 [Tripterygium wilfordii]